LRNARAVALHVQKHAHRIAIIPAGERWKHDFTLRPALEDWIGAGAVIDALSGSKSIEARAAQYIFRAYQNDLPSVLAAIGSGIELIDKGFEQDVELAAMLNVSQTVPRLVDSAYIDIS
jgi:2-phosphosulfolactate phosphatase